jgi:protein-disulfide isomerase
MANKTRQQSKSERAQTLMREQRRKERTRNWLVIGAVVVAIAIIGGVMFAISSNKDTSGKAVGTNGTPSNLTGAYNVVIGKSSAPDTIKMYEDFQCPICKEFEAATGSQVQAAVAAGKVKVDYHMVAFLDSQSTTNYSSRALNAGMAVLSSAGPDAFMKFHTIAYANQPEEGSAGVPDSTLIQWAVQAGADESTVTPMINGNVFHQWVVNATDQMSKNGVNGTPTVYINDKLQGGSPPSPQVAATAVLALVK